MARQWEQDGRMQGLLTASLFISSTCASELWKVIRIHCKANDMLFTYLNSASVGLTAPVQTEDNEGDESLRVDQRL
jgi:hypothetical protein